MRAGEVVLMARPQKEGMDYFPHDVHASSDQKLEPLLFLYGGVGYAFYFLHLEYIYREQDFAFDVSDAETRQILCSKLKISEQDYDKMLKTCFKHGCFDREFYEQTGKLTSNGIRKRAETVVKKRESMRQRHENKQEIVSAAETTPETVETTENKPHKVKERKVKERKEKREGEKRFSPPSLEEVEAYCRERGNGVDPVRWHAFYAAKNWMIGKNKMSDWRKAVITWETRDSGSGYSQQVHCDRCEYRASPICKGKSDSQRINCGSFREEAA